MTFTLGARSMSFVSRVDPRLVAVGNLAIQLSSQDFGYTEEQSRTLAQEEEKVRQGVSHTLKSHHIIDPATGHSTALDAVPWDDARRMFVWEWPAIYAVASAFKRAAAQLNTPVTWGAVWDRLMSEFPGDTPAACEAAEQAYVGRRRGLSGSAFVDGPHFELGRN